MTLHGKIEAQMFAAPSRKWLADRGNCVRVFLHCSYTRALAGAFG